jgi:hypothetical protein
MVQVWNLGVPSPLLYPRIINDLITVKGDRNEHPAMAGNPQACFCQCCACLGHRLSRTGRALRKLCDRPRAEAADQIHRLDHDARDGNKRWCGDPLPDCGKVQFALCLRPKSWPAESVQTAGRMPATRSAWDLQIRFPTTGAARFRQPLNPIIQSPAAEHFPWASLLAGFQSRCGRFKCQRRNGLQEASVRLSDGFGECCELRCRNCRNVVKFGSRWIEMAVGPLIRPASVGMDAIRNELLAE